MSGVKFHFAIGLRTENQYRAGVTNLFETESYFLVQIHAKGYRFDTHTSEIKICSICLQLCVIHKN